MLEKFQEDFSMGRNAVRSVAILCVIGASPAHAGEARILDAQARSVGDSWRFDVTVVHDDTGWDHYADGWKIETPDGTELGYRKLAHPHVDEQPFTRTLGGVSIPEGVASVILRVHDSRHGWSATPYRLELD